MHEVVDLGDSGDEDVGVDGDEDGEDDHDELERRRRNLRESGPEGSVMVLDSDSDSDSNEEDEEEYDQGRAGHTTSQSHGGYRPLPGENSSFSGYFDCAHPSRGHKRRSRRANRDRKQF